MRALFRKSFLVEKKKFSEVFKCHRFFAIKIRIFLLQFRMNIVESGNIVSHGNDILTKFAENFTSLLKQTFNQLVKGSKLVCYSCLYHTTAVACIILLQLPESYYCSCLYHTTAVACIILLQLPVLLQ